MRHRSPPFALLSHFAALAERLDRRRGSQPALALCVNHSAPHNKSCIVFFWRQNPGFVARSGRYPQLPAIFHHPAELRPGRQVEHWLPCRFQRKAPAREGDGIEDGVGSSQFSGEPTGRAERWLAEQRARAKGSCHCDRLRYFAACSGAAEEHLRGGTVACQADHGDTALLDETGGRPAILQAPAPCPLALRCVAPVGRRLGQGRRRRRCYDDRRRSRRWWGRRCGLGRRDAGTKQQCSSGQQGIDCLHPAPME
jgi:hypothetical protein